MIRRMGDSDGVAERTPRVDGDDWHRGFASALAAIWTVGRDAQLVRQVMVAGGIRLAALRSAGVPEIDLTHVDVALQRSANQADREMDPAR